MQASCASTMLLPQSIILTSGLLGNSHKAEKQHSQDFMLLSFGLTCPFKPPHVFAVPGFMLQPSCLPLSSVSKFLAHFCSKVFGFASFPT